MTTTSRTVSTVAKILIALIVLAVAFLVVGVLLYFDGRKQRREAMAKAAVKELQSNPDAAWLYAQGLTPTEIDMAFARRGGIK